VTRYLMIAGGSFVVFWWVLREKNQSRKLDSVPVSLKNIRREVGWSVLSSLIFLLPAFLIVKGKREGWLHVSAGPISDFGILPFFGQIIAMLVIHDFYFYCIHRSMHSRILYRWFHEVHHRSLSPTPWAAFSFHPLEALIESAVVYVFLFSFPMHLGALFVFQFLSLLVNVYGHLGYDITPVSWRGHWLLRFLNTTRNHHWHHQRFNGNFGFYTTLWDRLFGTYRELGEVAPFQQKHEPTTLKALC
jgi:sterol desaturase/sphingolipid hydroxylase (fatty acid hydroxylase superfamily)